MVIAMSPAPYNQGLASGMKGAYGIYELMDGDKRTVYIGMGMLPGSLLDHLKEAFLSGDVRYFRYEPAWSEEAAQRRLREEISRHMAIYGLVPKYNRLWQEYGQARIPGMRRPYELEA